MYNLEPVRHNPGISGFVKAHRHPTGPALVMSSWQQVAAVYWVKRLHHSAVPIGCNSFRLLNQKTMKAVERTYEIMASYGPPQEAYSEVPDYQRKRVYRWEEDNVFPFDDRCLSWDNCERFFNRVWKNAGTESEAKLVKSKRFTRPMAFSDQVFLPVCDKKSWTRPVLLHEISHLLEFPFQHGPRFVSRYMDLCVEFLGMKPEDLESSAARYGVLFA